MGGGGGGGGGLDSVTPFERAVGIGFSCLRTLPVLCGTLAASNARLGAKHDTKLTLHFVRPQSDSRFLT